METNPAAETKLRIAGTIRESIVDGPGIRFVVFAQGCRHNCEGCHNPETHSFEGGTETDIGKLLQEIRRNPLLDGITLSGGEPFEQADKLGELAEEVKKLGLNVITYSGYTFEHLKEHFTDREDWKRLLQATDILIDGRFELKKKSLLLKFRGSSNQRIIDVKKSFENTTVVEAL
ncbi:MAG: anaerobic ribonucleoside-triphosphate reductase activating protein [Clostridiales bacterium]|nr:anaerobic ribonucleoside-triphosphate reductase activating protein [Clostridiales bacterium]